MQAQTDILSQINDAVLDLQRATSQSYERPLRTLARLLKHSELADANKSLLRGVNLEQFLTDSEATSGSMIGSGRLVWPDDERLQTAICYELIQNFAERPDDLIHFGHEYLDHSNKIIDSIRAVVSQIILPFSRNYKNFVLSEGKTEPTLVLPKSEKIFIVHGHDGEAREMVARFISQIGLTPIILHEQANRGRTVIEKVEANSDVGFAVVLLTPDDEGCVKGGQPEPRARQNVLLELGYFIGKLTRERVCALKKGDLEIPSDFAGVVWEVMDTAGGWKQALSRELQAAGYDIDWNKVMR